MRKRWVAAFAAATALLSACGGGGGTGNDGASPAGEGHQDGEADPEGVVRLAYDLTAASRGGVGFDPAAAGTTVADVGIYHWVYGALMRPTGEGELVPDLAESVEVLDPATIEVVVRDGVTLSDGTPFDAEMVKAGLERNLAATDSAAFRAGFFALEEVEVTAPDTVVLHIPDGSAESWYEQFMGEAETVIVPEGTDVEDPVGAGPFVLVEHNEGESMVLERNPEYWDAGAIRVAGIELTNAPPDTEQAAVSALTAGQVDWARFDFSLIDAAGAGITVEAEPDPEMLMQFLVCKSEPPLDDVRVRQALSYAIDREAINDALFEGQGAPAWDLFPEGHPLHNDELTGHYAHDPDRARDLLEEAGVADGLTVGLMPIPGANVPEAAQIVQQQWEEVGVTMNIVQTSSFVDDFMVNRQAELGAIPRSGEGRGILDNISGDTMRNTCGYRDPELDALVEDLRGMSDSSEEGIATWAEIQEVAVHDALSIHLVFQPEVYGFDDARLGGYALVDYGIPVPDMWELFVEAG